MAFVGFREADLAWFGEAKTWRSAGGLSRSFCDHCGSQIGYRDERLPGEVYLTIGFMDAPEDFPPNLHAFEKRRLPFLHISDDLPRYQDQSVER